MKSLSATYTGLGLGFALGIAALLISGCKEGLMTQPSQPQLPADKRVNVVLLSGGGYATSQGEGADVVVVAKCRRVEEYAKTVRGDWVYHWYLVEWDVLKVERGRWPATGIAFVFADAWPTPESGIRLKRAEFPYVTGRVFAFSLNTAVKPPVVVSKEERSRIPPHGVLQRPGFDVSTPDGKAEYDAIMNAVRTFEIQKEIYTDGGCRISDDTPAGYVVEHWTDFGKGSQVRAYLVEKKTYRVRPAP